MGLSWPEFARLRLPRAAAVFGALGSVLLNAMVFEAFLWGSGEGQRPQHRSGFAASALAAESTPLGVLILIDASSDALHHADPTDQLGSLGHLLASPLLTIASPTVSLANFDFLDDSSTAVTATDQTTGDQRERAALFGLYMRQVQARIERAWQHPGNSPPAGAFTCRVQISQGKHGQVREVQLMDCTNDLSWRLSLVNAIDAASPLPAPPDPRVFADLLRLSFHAQSAPFASSAPAVVPPPPSAGTVLRPSSAAAASARPPPLQGQRP